MWPQKTKLFFLSCSFPFFLFFSFSFSFLREWSLCNKPICKFEKKKTQTIWGRSRPCRSVWVQMQMDAGTQITESRRCSRLWVRCGGEDEWIGEAGSCRCLMVVQRSRWWAESDAEQMRGSSDSQDYPISFFFQQKQNLGLTNTNLIDKKRKRRIFANLSTDQQTDTN